MFAPNLSEAGPTSRKHIYIPLIPELDESLPAEPFHGDIPEVNDDLPAEPAPGGVPKQNETKCSFDMFIETLTKSEVFARQVAHKRAHGNIPSYDALNALEGIAHRIQGQRARQLYRDLTVLSRRRKTLALIYGAAEDHYSCAWLVGSGGVLASATLMHQKIDTSSESYDPFNKIGLIHLFERMLVDSRSASRAPTKRSPGKDCHDAVAEPPLSEKQIEDELSALNQVSQLLLPPEIAGALLRNADINARLLILPVASLQKVPFPALQLGGRNLVDFFATMIVPSADEMTFGQRRPQPTTKQSLSLVIGNPDLSSNTDYCWPKLPEAESEAQFVAQQFSSESPMLGKAANFNEVTHRLKAGESTLKYIHFSTHGLSNEENPADGGFLALTGRHLRGADFRKLKFKFTNKPIVVMSACFSGLGKVFPAGIFGLYDFWLGAGASQLVVSLWGVSDIGTRRLMEYFASQMSSSHLSGKNFPDGAEDAMAEAMRKLKKDVKDPAIWAAFTVIGTPAP